MCLNIKLSRVKVDGYIKNNKLAARWQVDVTHDPARSRPGPGHLWPLYSLFWWSFMSTSSSCKLANKTPFISSIAATAHYIILRPSQSSHFNYQLFSASFIIITIPLHSTPPPITEPGDEWGVGTRATWSAQKKYLLLVAGLTSYNQTFTF